MTTTRLILVGGFLGAGKTTLLLQAARRLAAQGYRVGLVTNDQGDQLVDTALADDQQIPVTEVAGGCFCCRFPDLIVALRRLQKSVNPDVILAEPVGSCTDILATVVRPLHEYYGEIFEVAPFSVLYDPERSPEEFPQTVAYLHAKQLAEAEIILLNKQDLLTSQTAESLLADLRPRYANAHLLGISARTGDGVDGWLSHVMAQRSTAMQILDLDYQQYAEAEAALGWLNAKGTLRSNSPFSPRNWLADLLQTLADAFAAASAPIGHVKAHIITPTATLKASLTSANRITWDGVDGRWLLVNGEGDSEGNHQQPITDNHQPTTNRAQFILNARVNTEPSILERTVRQALERCLPAGDTRQDLTHFECFRPLPPQPTHRL
jgi:G3E family GTPase